MSNSSDLHNLYNLPDDQFLWPTGKPVVGSTVQVTTQNGTIPVYDRGLVVKDADGNDVDVGEFITSVNKRLCIIQPSLEAHEKYPALKDAYDQYKMLEKLLMEGDNANKD